MLCLHAASQIALFSWFLGGRMKEKEKSHSPTIARQRIVIKLLQLICKIKKLVIYCENNSCFRCLNFFNRFNMNLVVCFVIVIVVTTHPIFHNKTVNTTSLESMEHQYFLDIMFNTGEVVVADVLLLFNNSK